MRIKLFLLALLFSIATNTQAMERPCPDALDFHKRSLTGTEKIHLCEAFRGQVVLVVNTASKCAYTPQYEGLETLYERYRERGLQQASLGRRI